MTPWVQHTLTAELHPAPFPTSLPNPLLFPRYSTFSSAFSHYNCHPHGVTHDLIQIFRDNQVTHVYNVGIAGDYCLKSTAVDAAKVGFKSYVVKEGVRSVDEGAEGWGAACKEMEDVGVELVNLEGIEVGWVKEEGGK